MAAFMEQTMGKEFQFKLGQQVAIKVSGETGEVLGRAEYSTAENNYFLRYRAVDGRAVEAWWQESSLQAA